MRLGIIKRVVWSPLTLESSIVLKELKNQVNERRSRGAGFMIAYIAISMKDSLKSPAISAMQLS